MVSCSKAKDGVHITVKTCDVGVGGRRAVRHHTWGMTQFLKTLYIYYEQKIMSRHHGWTNRNIFEVNNFK